MSNRGVKIGLLVLTLVLPVALYLFLQGFGKNQYAVALFYQEGLKTDNPNCHEASVPHKLPDFTLRGIDDRTLTTSDIGGRLNIFGFLSEGCAHQGAVLEEMARVSNNYRDNPRVGCLSVLLDSAYVTTSWEDIRSTYNLRNDNWNLLQFSDASPVLMACGFNLPASCKAVNQLVLVDGQLRIRGYYTANDRQEVDRLITEIEILLMNGEDA